MSRPIGLPISVASGSPTVPQSSARSGTPAATIPKSSSTTCVGWRAQRSNRLSGSGAPGGVSAKKPRLRRACGTKVRKPPQPSPDSRAGTPTVGVASSQPLASREGSRVAIPRRRTPERAGPAFGRREDFHMGSEHRMVAHPEHVVDARFARGELFDSGPESSPLAGPRNVTKICGVHGRPSFSTDRRRGRRERYAGSVSAATLDSGSTRTRSRRERPRL